jgi:hypothetical protein
MLGRKHETPSDPLDLLAKAESGDSRVSVSDQCQSPQRSSGTKTLYFIKTADPCDYILSRDSTEGEFVMLGRLDEKAREFRVYHKKPTEPDFSASSPDFRLTWDQKAEKWTVVMCSEALVCNTCLYRSRSVSYCEDKPVILSISQGLQRSEKADQHWSYMDVDGISTEFGDNLVECRRCRSARTDSVDTSPLMARSSFTLFNEVPPAAPRSELHLKSVIPTMNKSGDLSIRFMTRGRTIMPSARNLQIVTNSPENQSTEIVLQFVKVSATKFNIDFRAPLSPIQAFCVALSTHYWK